MNIASYLNFLLAKVSHNKNITYSVGAFAVFIFAWLSSFFVIADSVSIFLIVAGVILLVFVGYFRDMAIVSQLPRVFFLFCLSQMVLSIFLSYQVFQIAWRQGEINSFVGLVGAAFSRADITAACLSVVILFILNVVLLGKGVARVAEVAARFALDALPGRQLGIEADIRAGILSSAEAQRKRSDLDKESALYGALDGSIKFLQSTVWFIGFISVAQFIGGGAIALFHGTEVLVAIHKALGPSLGYALLQLSISLVLGLTAVLGLSTNFSSPGSESDSKTNRGDNLSFVFVAFAMFTPLIAFASLMTWAAAAVTFVLFIELAICLYTEKRNIAAQPDDYTSLVVSSSKELLPSFENETSVEVVINPISLNIETGSAAVLNEIFEKLARDYYAVWGVKLPKIRLRFETSISAQDAKLIFGQYASRKITLVPAESLVVVAASNFLKSLSFTVIDEVVQPMSGQIATIITDTVGAKSVLSKLGVSTYGPAEYLGMQLIAFCRDNQRDIVGLSFIKTKFEELRLSHKLLVEEVIDKGILSYSELTFIAQYLMGRGISIRDGVRLLELISEFSSKLETFEDRAEGIQALTCYLQTRLFYSHFCYGGLAHRAFATGSDVEDLLRNTGDSADTINAEQMLAMRMKRIVTPLYHRGVFPIILVCETEIRAKFERFLHDRMTWFRNFVVIPYSELGREFEPEMIGTITIGE